MLRDGADVELARTRAYDALRALHITVDVLACTATDYERRQHDPGFLSWLVAREGRVLHSTGAVPQRSLGERVREGHPREGVAVWVRRAHADLREAELSLSAAEPVWDAICFHSHACVEKLLKALIVARGTFPPRSHNLRELLALQPSALRETVPLSRACDLLMDLYPRSRYPEETEPTSAEARVAIAVAREARRILTEAMGDGRLGGG